MADGKDIPKNLSPEVTSRGSRNKPGVYRHGKSGKSLTALSVPAADAFVHQGFKYVGPVPPKAKASKVEEAKQKSATQTAGDPDSSGSNGEGGNQ